MESPSKFQISRILQRTGMAETIDLWQARKDSLAHLNYTKGYSPRTCYNYHSDLGIWGREEAGKDWRSLSHIDVEQFAGWQIRERGVKAHIVSRRASCLSSFYKWAMKNGLLRRTRSTWPTSPSAPTASRCGWRKRNRRPCGRPRGASTISPRTSSGEPASTSKACAGAMTSSSG
jgi:integrase family protein with SAM-like domain